MGFIWRDVWSSVPELEHLCEISLGPAKINPQLFCGAAARKEFSSVRKRILLQFASFLQRLGRSVNSEIRIMSRIVACVVRSVTARNCLNMVREFSLDPWIVPAFKFKKEYKMYEVPEPDHWRPSLLSSLLREKYELNVTGENTKTITELIESLCSS